jgi:hypothetical protein
MLITILVWQALSVTLQVAVLLRDIIISSMNKSVSGIKNGNNRSVRDIKPNHRQKQTHQNNQDNSSGNGNRPPRRSRNKQAATYGMWFLGLVVLLLLFFLFSVLFSQTTVTVTPRTSPISIESEFTASPAGSGTSSADTLNYSLKELETSRSQTTQASGTEYRQQRASGEMRIINENTSEPIQLVANTRFRSPDGNIYRTESAVTVPGVSSGEPGQVTVPVVADSAGSDFNVSEGTQFSIPGFAGTEQEGEVYGQSASEIGGGIDREVPMVSTSSRRAIVESLRSDLEDSLKSELSSNIGSNEIIYEDGQFFTTNATTEVTSNGRAEVVVTGTLQAVTFGRRALSIFLANQSGISVDADARVSIQDINNFDFSITDDFQPGEQTQLPFSISGDSLVVWEYNKQALSRDLYGLQKNQVAEVLDNYPSIDSAEINTQPFWKRSLPQDRDDITIITKLPGEENN